MRVGDVVEVGVLEFQRAVVDAAAHEVVVEGPGAGWGVDGGEPGGEFGIAAQVNSTAAFLPEKELEKAFDVEAVERGGVGVVDEFGAPEGTGSVRALKTDGKGAAAGFAGGFSEGAVPRRGGQEAGIEFWHVAQFELHGGRMEEDGRRINRSEE